MRKLGKFLAVSSLFVSLVITTESGVSQTSNTWSAAGQMDQARAGAAVVLLSDGRLLITGGSDVNGVPQASTETFDPATGQFSPAPPMNVARTHHAAITLNTGDVLVTGGVTDTGGDYTDTAEIFSVSTQQWTQLQATLAQGLAGHAMAVLSDGNVIIAGGSSTVGPVSSLLLFNLSDESITPISSLLTARTNAAAAAAPNGRVLIAGGTDISGAVLNSTEIFTYSPDSMTGTVAVGPNMTSPRTLATATSTYDGVAVIGGSNGTVDLGSAEIFSQWTSAFRVVTGATPRNGHFAAMLPFNGGILATGGTGGQAVDILQPWANATAGAFVAAAGSLSNHAGGFAAPVGLGSLLTAGGQGASGNTSELYWFPTIATDQSDYAPGSPVVMTGAGFRPTENVALHLHEWVNQTLTDLPDYKVTAGNDGRFSFTGYAPTANDFGARYHLTAVGESSGFQAQTVFTDAGTPTVSCAPVSVPVNSSTTCTASIPGQGGTGDSIEWSTNGNGGFSPSTCTISSSNPGTCSVTFTPTSAANGGQTVTATDGTKTGTFHVTVTKITPTLSVTNSPLTYSGSAQAAVVASSVAGVVSNIRYNGSSTVPIAAGTYAVTANFTPTDTTDYNTLTGAAAGNLVINKATPTLSVTNSPIPYNASAQAATLAANGPAGVVSGSFTNVRYSNSLTVPTNVATYVVTANFTPTDTTNYNSLTGASAGNFAIQQVTPSFTNLTASQSINYGTSSVTLSGKLAGSPVAPPTGSTIGITINGVLTSTTTTDSVGNFSTSIVTSGLSASTTPYTITYSYAATTNFGAASNALTSLTTNKANAIVVVTPYTVTYNGQAHTAAITSITGVNGETNGTVGTVDLTHTSHTSAGIYSADFWTFTGTANYNNIPATTITDTHNKANATVTVTPNTVTYDGQAHTAAITSITGVNG